MWGCETSFQELRFTLLIKIDLAAYTAVCDCGHKTTMSDLRWGDNKTVHKT